MNPFTPYEPTEIIPLGAGSTQYRFVLADGHVVDVWTAKRDNATADWPEWECRHYIAGKPQWSGVLETACVRGMLHDVETYGRYDYCCKYEKCRNTDIEPVTVTAAGVNDGKPFSVNLCAEHRRQLIEPGIHWRPK